MPSLGSFLPHAQASRDRSARQSEGGSNRGPIWQEVAHQVAATRRDSARRIHQAIVAAARTRSDEGTAKVEHARIDGDSVHLHAFSALNPSGRTPDRNEPSANWRRRRCQPPVLIRAFGKSLTGIVSRIDTLPRWNLSESSTTLLRVVIESLSPGAPANCGE